MTSNNKATLLLGTNLGDREINLARAIKGVEKEVGNISFKSKVKETKPVGFTAEMDFYNQIIQVDTILSPIKLLNTLKHIESKMGRIYTKPKKGEKYTSRIIDLDILFYNDIVYNSCKLTLPHEQVFKRDFVSKMLDEIRLC